MSQIQTLITNDQQPLNVRHWPCESPIAKVQLLHGMAEHADRYANFAQYLNQHNIEVIAHNHRGHGERTPQGHFADNNGWQLALGDVTTAQQAGNQEVPLFLLGHSMGSFIARAWSAQHPNTLAGLLLAGSNQQHPVLFYAARALAKGLTLVQGKQHTSGIMNFLSFGSFNRAFKPTQTDFDWLCSDADVVNTYIADPKCGFLCTTQFWHDFMGGLISICSKKGINALNTDLPVFIFGGDKDPVGQMGKGLTLLERALVNAGNNKVQLKVYPNARHEILNETNKEEVWEDLVRFLMGKI